MEILSLQSSSDVPPFYLRSRSVVSPFLRIGEKWDLHGICKGIKRDLQVRKNFAIVCDNTRKIGI
jgi:hypothetical protein